MRILIAEDNPKIALALQKGLARSDMRQIFLIGRQTSTSPAWPLPTTCWCWTSCFRTGTGSNSAANCAMRGQDARDDAHRSGIPSRRSPA